MKVDEHLCMYDLSYNRKISVHSFVKDFDPSFMTILDDGDSFIGLQKTSG